MFTFCLDDPTLLRIGENWKTWIICCISCVPTERSLQAFLISIRACLHGGGGPQVGEVTRLAVVEKWPGFTCKLTTPGSQGDITRCWCMVARHVNRENGGWTTLGGLPHLESFTWQNATPADRVTLPGRPGNPPRRVTHLSCKHDHIIKVLCEQTREVNKLVKRFFGLCLMLSGLGNIVVDIHF